MDLKVATNADLIAELAARLSGAVAGRQLEAASDRAPANDGMLINEDFYVTDRLAAQAGAFYRAWATLGTTMGLIHGDRPLHTLVVAAGDPDGALTSPADIGWTDREAYKYDPARPPADCYHDWIDAGCPSWNKAGKYTGSGQPMEPDAWAKHWATFRASSDAAAQPAEPQQPAEGGTV